MLNIEKLTPLLAQLKQQNPEIYASPGRTTSADIEKVENALEVTFCEDYKLFVQTYGYVYSPNFGLCGIRSGEPTALAGGLVLYETQEFRNLTKCEKKYTVLYNDDGFYFLLVDNETGKVFDYDLNIDAFSLRYESLEKCLFANIQGQLNI